MNDYNSDRPELRAGLILAGLHYKIVPIGQGQKYPPIQKWQEAATDDLDQVATWLAETDYGIGWAMGLQPNGKHLFCVDVDGSEGVESLVELLGEHGMDGKFADTCHQQTGSGGFHYVFEAPYEVRNSAKQFAPSIDIRGEGGQIVCGPTIHPNGTAYRWLKGPKKNPPQLAPQWVLDRLIEMAEPEPVPHRGTQVAHLLSGDTFTNDGETPMGFLNRTFDGFDALMRLGWKEASRRGEESQMVRPGKEVREGTGGTYHHDTGVFNVYSTGIAPEYGWVGKSNRDGSLMLAPADLWMVENGYRSVSEASSVIRKTLMPRSVPAPIVAGVLEHHHDEGEEHGSENPSLNLPDEFWNARPVLTHIKQAAWHSMSSPDAVLGAAMARYSASLPPQVKLPNDGTLDLFFVIQGHSGSGKSKAGKTARRLLPLDDIKGVMMDANVGSGEGLAEAFFGWVDEDGNPCGATKNGAKKVRIKHGMHFATDEGEAFKTNAARMGSTLVSTLCSAWMGESIGTMLADPTKSRIIPPMQVRVSAEVRIQTVHGWKLFDEQFAGTGLSQRMVCLPATDPNFFETHKDGTPVPDFPGELRMMRPTIIGGERVLTYVDSIRQLIHMEGVERQNPAWVGSALDTHRTLSTAKMAGILALWDGRYEIDETDWALASTIFDTHVANRNLLQQTQILAQEKARMTKVTHEVEREMAVHGAKEAEMLGKTVHFIRTKIGAGVYPSKRVLSGPKRAYYEEARALLEEEGIWPLSDKSEEQR